MIVNLIDENIAHAPTYNGTLEKNRTTKNISYVKMQPRWDGVSIFTDKFIQHHDKVISQYKVAWIMEPRAYDPIAYQLLEKNIDFYDIVMTYDESLLKTFPEKTKFIPADGLFIDTNTIFSKNITKTNMCSHIYSEKTILKGHRLRHEIANEIKTKKLPINLYGRGSEKPLKQKSDGLSPYYFSIVVENNQSNNYFTEKILDCFASRTIPIYWGAKNIERWFDLDSIIMFENTNELLDVLNSLNIDLYYDKFESLNKNYKKSLEYYDYDEKVYQILKEEFYSDE